MNNLEMAKDFIGGCDTITSLFVGLGKEDKLYSLYANWKETVWGKAEGGVPIARVEYKTQHLVNLAIDFDNAQEKAKVFCKKQRVINGLYLAKEPSKQNPYDFRTPEEIAEEKAEKIRYEKIKGDIAWVRRMGGYGRIDHRLKANQLHYFQMAKMSRDKAKQVLPNMNKPESNKHLDAKEFVKMNFEGASKLRKEAIQISILKKHWKDDAIKQAKKTNFVGNVGDKVEVELTVNKITGYSTQWNYINIYTMSDNDGNIFVYRGSADLADKNRSVWNAPVKENHKIVVTGKVKEHSKYRPRNFEKLCIKQTRLERIKVIKSLNVNDNGNIIEGVN